MASPAQRVMSFKLGRGLVEEGADDGEGWEEGGCAGERAGWLWGGCGDRGRGSAVYLCIGVVVSSSSRSQKLRKVR